MEKIILSDVDGVLLDWNSGYDRFMRKEKGLERVENTDHFYGLGKRFGISQKLAVEFAFEYNESDYLRTLLAYQDAKHYVKLLADRGFKFILISSMSDKEHAIANRSFNLKEIFGECMLDVHGLHPEDDKQTVLRNWADSGLFWIEDHFKNAEAGYEEGLRPILVDTDYNSHYQTDLFPRTSRETPWADIYRMVMSFYEGY